MFDRQNYQEKEIQMQEVSSRQGTPSNPFARRIYERDSGNALKLVWHPGLQTRVFRSVGKLPKEIEYSRKHIPYEEVDEQAKKVLWEECRQAERISEKMRLDADEWQRVKDLRLKRIQEESRALGKQLLSAEREILKLSAERQSGRISQEQYETAYREHWEMEAEQSAGLEALLKETQCVEIAFSRKNPWLKMFAGYADELDALSGNADFMKKRIERIECIRFQELAVELREQEWKRYFPEEWLAEMDWKEMEKSSAFSDVCIADSCEKKEKEVLDERRKRNRRESSSIPGRPGGVLTAFRGSARRTDGYDGGAVV